MSVLLILLILLLLFLLLLLLFLLLIPSLAVRGEPLVRIRFAQQGRAGEGGGRMRRRRRRRRRRRTTTRRRRRRRRRRKRRKSGKKIGVCVMCEFVHPRTKRSFSAPSSPLSPPV
jgi:hypothetical protein